MPLLTDQTDHIYRIRLEGEIDISTAEELKGRLLDAIGAEREMRIGLESATDIDITAIQLLYAAKRDAAAAGVLFIVEDPIPAALSSLMTDAGFADFQSES